MLNDWSHKVRAILKEYCPGNIKKLLPSLSQSGNTRFYFDHQKLCMDNNLVYWMNASAVGSRPYLWGSEPENLRVSDPLRCISKHSETFLSTLYMLNLYISMIYLYISIRPNEFYIDT